MRHERSTGMLAGGLLLLSVVTGLAGCAAAPLIPAPTPADDRRIAVLTLTVTSTTEGAVESAQMEEGRIVPGFGPNVLGLAGSWTVLLATDGEEVVSFGTFDPRRVEVEGREGEEPFSSIFEGTARWDLVVPLHDAEGRDLQVRAIGLLDETGRLIFAAALADDEVRPMEIPPGRPPQLFQPFLTTLGQQG